MKLSAESANAALWDNSYTTLSTCYQSTGFRSPLLNYTQQEWRYTLADDFLVNTYLRRNDPELTTSIRYYLSPHGVQTVALIDQECETENSIPLPKPTKLELSVGETISNRRSVREYTGDAIEFEYLTALLSAGNGVSSVAEVTSTEGTTATFHLRTVASGGGLYPVQLWVCALNINGVSPGIYRYQPLSNRLIPQFGKEVMLQTLTCYSGAEDMLKTSAALILLVGKPWRSMRKYGDKGLRFVLHEAGAISQNIHLAVSALGLGSVDYAGCYEEELHSLLRFNGVSTVMLHSIIVGVPGI